MNLVALSLDKIASVWKTVDSYDAHFDDEEEEPIPSYLELFFEQLLSQCFLASLFSAFLRTDYYPFESCLLWSVSYLAYS